MGCSFSDPQRLFYVKIRETSGDDAQEHKRLRYYVNGT